MFCTANIELETNFDKLCFTGIERFSTENIMGMFVSVLQGPYWSHIREAWERRDHPNLFWLYYEDMIEDLPRELKRLDHFLGTGLTQDQLTKLAQHGSFSSMKKNPCTNFTLSHSLSDNRFTKEKNFVRKGLLNVFSHCCRQDEKKVNYDTRIGYL